jgi:N-acetylmuramoyl-L-alanine amidase
MSTIKKIALIVGHGNGDSGAMGWNGMSEFNFNQFVADEIENRDLGKEIRVFYRGPSGITGVSAKAVMWRPDLTIELHLNAFNGKAKGCEVLCLKGDLDSETIAKDFSHKFTTHFKRVLRGKDGIKWISKNDRGGLNLRSLATIKQRILIEPFFIDNPEEWISPMIYADFLSDWIKEL